MGPMLRRLFNVLAVLSLLLFVDADIRWVRHGCGATRDGDWSDYGYDLFGEYESGPLVFVSYVSVMILTALFSLGWVVGWRVSAHRRGRQVTRGFCPVCGYDLRATPNGCPECG